MRIPEFAVKTELFAYLKDNQKEIIAKKRSILKEGAKILSAPTLVTGRIGLKSEAAEDPNALLVAVVANASGFMDSHKDVIIPGAPTKSIQERKHLIPHLHDHIHQTTAEVGVVKDIYTRSVSARDLGYDSDMASEALIFETEIRKDFNEKIFARYKDRRATQHSIGLRYVKLYLCIDYDDPSYSSEKDNYDKYLEYVINKEEVEKDGYFYAVTEYQLIENSTVLFGSNPYTPTLETTDEKSAFGATKLEPSTDTQTLAQLDRLLTNFKTLNNAKNN